MMFRAKSKIEFPAKPSPPSLDQMEEDLKEASKNDVVFTMFRDPETTDEEIKHLLSTIKDKDVASDKSRNSLFLCAMKCVVMNQNLKNEVIEMNDTNLNLGQVCEDLKENVEKVKMQASGAINKS